MVYVPPGSTAPESNAQRPLSSKHPSCVTVWWVGVGLSHRMAPPAVTVAAAGT